MVEELVDDLIISPVRAKFDVALRAFQPFQQIGAA
jgi:hypothetical protein